MRARRDRLFSSASRSERWCRADTPARDSQADLAARVAAITLDLEIVHFRAAEQVLFEAGFVSRQRAKLVDREHDRALGSMTRNDLRAILLRLFNHFA